MSGRLVILPHKSWNVWNRDNREKVARDERLFQEAQSALIAKEREILQEQQLELLTQSVSSAEEKKLIPFRLFDDLEQKINDNRNNEDYIKEKMKKENIEQKNNGTAPLALGESCLDKDAQPWYAMKSHLNTCPSKKNEKEEIKEKRARDNNRKNQSDPMKSFVKPRYDDSSHHSLLSDNQNCITLKKSLLTKHDKNDLSDFLRAKRIQREKVEKRKTDILLAQHDIYGNQHSYQVLESHTQQYHPHLIKRRKAEDN